MQLLHNTFITAQLFVTVRTNREKIEGGRCVSVVRVEEVKLPYPELDLTPGKNICMSSSLKIFPCWENIWPLPHIVDESERGEEEVGVEVVDGGEGVVAGGAQLVAWHLELQTKVI